MLSSAVLSLVLLANTSTTTRDSQVVEAGMLAFFQQADWNTRWTKGDFVVLRGAYGPGNDWSVQQKGFTAQFDRLREWQLSHVTGYAPGGGDQSDKAWNERALLVRVKKEAGSDVGHEEVGLTPLDQLHLDPRIIVDVAKAGTGGLRPGQEAITNAAGKAGTIRAVAILEPPAFSSKGGYAMLTAHCYRNACDLILLLQARQGKWNVIDVFVGVYI